jgi:arylsulfatase A-like enzyme
MYKNLRLFSGRPDADRSGSASIIGIGLSLVFCLEILRAYILADDLTGAGVLAAVSRLAAASYQDLTLSILLTAAFLVLVRLFTARWKFVTSVFFATGLVAVLWGAANIEVVKILGEPLTLNWLYYSDFFRGIDAINGIAFSITLRNFIGFTLIVTAFSLCALFFRNLVRRLTAARPSAALLVVLILAICLSLPTLFFGNSSNPDAKTLNPVVAFVHSAFFSQSPDILSAPRQIDDAEGIVQQSQLQIPPLPPAGRKTVKNVVFFVLESAPAEYVQNYGGNYEVTPNLLKYASKAHQFENIYAHAPATNYSLFSLITSLYPEIGTRSMTEKYPELPLRSIGNVFSERGYRTGLFNSSDTRFQSSDVFLRDKGFDVVQDYRGRSCDTAVYRNSSDEWRYLDFSNDLCTVRSLTKWIDADPGKPFFGLMWTGMTHYPYFTEGAEQKYTSNINLNRYLNALHTGDEAFGALMRYLEEHQLAESTLVVVFGDHGEAFGRHRTFVHASGLYEENVHIPLLLINGELFSGSKSDVLGGINDISPTVLDILQLPIPSGWQGHSLFGSKRPQRIFFFAPWNGFQLGFRQGARKFIYYAERKQIEIYDLDSDPREKLNLAGQIPEAAENAKQLLIAWAQLQNKHIADLLTAHPAPVSAPHPNGAKLSIRIAFDASGTSYLTPPQGQLLVDDTSVGYFEVKTAPNNSERDVSQADIDAAFTPFEFSVESGKCPRKMEIRFLNDEWAGEGKTGDTNLFVKGIRVNGADLAPDRIRVESSEVGSSHNDHVWMYRKGSVHMELDPKAVCG